MFNELNKNIYDSIGEGIIFIDRMEKIHLFNRSAMETFGLIDRKSINHLEGFLAKGDLVCIATNSLGADDGDLNRNALSKLGYDADLEYSKAFIIVGKYLDDKNSPIYFYGKNNVNQHNHSIEFEDLIFKVEINNDKKFIDIQVDDESFRLDYIYAISHMVIIDSVTRKIKFVQSLGYTARNESPRKLLEGFRYKGKGEYFEPQNIIGKSISTILESNSTIETFIKAAKGIKTDYIKQFTVLNNFPTLCSIKSVNLNRDNNGAVLIIEDISKFKKITDEKDYVLNKLYELQKNIKKFEKDLDLMPTLIGRSNKMMQVKKLANNAAKSNSNLLILGESGTGKSLLAKEIHYNSARRDFPLIHVNCASIPENLLESELFGYESGAFTGASKKGKKGKFELADGGTIFLDEIGEMNVFLQAKILKVIQDKNFFRVGGDKEISVNIRIIAATNKNLADSINDKTFRKDLYYRLNVLSINMPSLRDVSEDIEALTDNLLPAICMKIGVKTKKISRSAFLKLHSYSFPGNVRELENILERAVNLTTEDVITSADLIFENCDSENSFLFKSLKTYTKNTEKKVIIEALIYYDGDLNKTMKSLVIKKSSLYQKIKEYNIDLSKILD
jgi:transcriptional regulator with PAS, ATPase and Fis domain